MLTKDPKSNLYWMSKKYRKWMQKNKACFIKSCFNDLASEKPNYLSHHHRHSGSMDKKKCRDSLLIPMCLRCHNEFHFNESKFNWKHQLIEDRWMEPIVKSLMEYVESLNINAWWVCVNALSEVAKENE